MDITFTVPGVAVGKGRPRFARRGAGVVTYTPEKTVSYESLVKVQAYNAMRGAEITPKPVAVTIWLFIKPPASWSKRMTTDALQGRLLPVAKPDIDNVVKTICDALNGVVWIDDKQVVVLRAIKRYDDTPAVRVTVAELNPAENNSKTS